MDNDKGLKRELGMVTAVATVIGMIIGSGIFMKPAVVISAAGDSTMALAAWILGGVMSLAGGLTVAELAAQFPKTGGMYAWLNEVYGDCISYLYGWVHSLIFAPATYGALSLYFGILLAQFMGMPASSSVVIAVVTLLFTVGINCLGAKYGGIIATLSTIGKLVPIVLIIVFGLMRGDVAVMGMPSGVAESAGFGAAILATLWAYEGWISVGNIGGELTNPSKQLPIAITGGLIAVIAAYAGINAAMMHVLPASEIVSLGTKSAGQVAVLLFGEFGGNLLGIGILISLYGALSGNILTLPRIPYAMASRGQYPMAGLVGKTHPTFRTPVNATVFQTVIAIALMTLGNPDRLTDIAIFVIWIAYVAGFTAVFMSRKKFPDAVRTYKVPLYPFVPIVAIAGAGYILFSTLINSPTDCLWSLLFAGIGIPVFYWLKKSNKAQANM